MIFTFNIAFLLVLFAHKCASFTFEAYKDALTNSDEDCRKVFSSLDVITQFKFFDASAKIPIGLLQGHFNNIGAFDECLSIDIPEKNVLGKYCTATIDIPAFLAHLMRDDISLPQNVTNFLKATTKNNKWDFRNAIPPRNLRKIDFSSPLTFGICLPDKCLYNSSFVRSLSLKFNEDLCVTNKSNSEMSTKARIAWYIIIAFFVVAVVSTIYDVVMTQQGKEPHHDILIAFSFYINGRKLFKTSKNPSQLLCLHGLKTLNIIWVVAGHTYGTVIKGPIDNYMDLFGWIHSYSSMLIAGATVSVDSFFTMGGILSVYTLLRSEDPGLKTNIKNIPMLYLHRYLRLTPAFAIIIYINWAGLNLYMSDGPNWHVMDSDQKNCEQNWWAALLYIQNYRAHECVGQSWYLSVDMQLFLLSPLIWIPLRVWPKRTLQAMYGLLCLGIAIPFGLAFYYKLPATLVGVPDNDYMNIYYMKTHARFSTYVIGMIAGYFIYHAKQKKNVVINPVAVFWMWTLTLVVLYGCVYGGFPLVDNQAPKLSGNMTEIDEATRWWNSLYIALCRPAWSTALAVLIYLCVTGYGGPVNWFLSAGPMQFLGKLSYCIYLNHVLFILFRFGQTRDTLHFSNWEIVNYLMAIMMTIIPASIIHTLLFESPMICIEKILFRRNKSTETGLNTSKNTV